MEISATAKNTPPWCHKNHDEEVDRKKDIREKIEHIRDVISKVFITEDAGFSQDGTFKLRSDIERSMTTFQEEGKIGNYQTVLEICTEAFKNAPEQKSNIQEFAKLCGYKIFWTEFGYEIFCLLKHDNVLDETSTEMLKAAMPVASFLSARSQRQWAPREALLECLKGMINFQKKGEVLPRKELERMLTDYYKKTFERNTTQKYAILNGYQVFWEKTLFKLTPAKVTTPLSLEAIEISLEVTDFLMKFYKETSLERYHQEFSKNLKAIVNFQTKKVRPDKELLKILCRLLAFTLNPLEKNIIEEFARLNGYEIEFGENDFKKFDPIPDPEKPTHFLSKTAEEKEELSKWLKLLEAKFPRLSLKNRMNATKADDLST